MQHLKSLASSILGGAVLALALKGLGGWLAGGSQRPSRAAGGARYEPIDRYIEAQMERLSIPGAALAVVEGDHITHLRGFGRARPGGEAPTAQTPFFIGSLTKSFTALGVMQLVEAGKVALDAPVTCYLPWFRLADPEAAERITVRHLLNQTSGLPMAAGMATLTNFDNRPDAMERQARALSTLAPARRAGQACEYCNLNYDLLGLVIEAASGERYPAYIQKHIFDPLGMRHSYTAKAAAKQNGLAAGHRYWFGLPIPAPDLPVPGGSLASGQLIASVEDMARYLAAHINGGRVNGVCLLSEAGMQALHEGAAAYIEWGGTPLRYAMGWFDSGEGPARTVSHGGNVPDFSSYMGFLPEQKKGLVLLINADHYGLPPVMAEVGGGAAALLGGLPPAPIRLGSVPWLMRLLPLIPLFQLAGLLRMVRRRRENPTLHPARGQVLRHGLPVLSNLLLAGVPLLLRSRRMFGYLRLFNPDVYWTALVSGGLASVWAVLHAGKLLQSLGRARPPGKQIRLS